MTRATRITTRSLLLAWAVCIAIPNVQADEEPPPPTPTPSPSACNWEVGDCASISHNRNLSLVEAIELQINPTGGPLGPPFQFPRYRKPVGADLPISRYPSIAVIPASIVIPAKAGIQGYPRLPPSSNRLEK